jgi:hypothetical protein
MESGKQRLEEAISIDDTTMSRHGNGLGSGRVGWIKNLTCEKNMSDKKLHPDPHPHLKFQTHVRTRRVLVPVGFVNGVV